MGLLSQGSPLNWVETKKYADHVRKHGILQFLNIYNKVKDRQKDVLKWGDEVRLLHPSVVCLPFIKPFCLRRTPVVLLISWLYLHAFQNYVCYPGFVLVNVTRTRKR